MKVNAVILVPFLVLTFFACKKESGSTHLKVRLTDAPASFEEVNVDLIEVNIKLENDSNAWVSMSTAAGIYNLLALQNGIDTLISEAVVPAGKVKEIRLVLGSENSVKVAGEVLPLIIPSGSSSGLKIKIDKQMRAGADSLLIDFDAGLSVKLEQDGYKLRPVLKLIP